MHSCCSGLFSLVVILVLTYDRVEISGTGCMDFFFLAQQGLHCYTARGKRNVKKKRTKT